MLGFVGYLRNFIPNFSIKLVPLYDLLKKENKFEWTPEAEKCLQEIKHNIKKNRTLHLPDLEKPFIIHTNASNFGIGAALLQEIHNERRIIQWASRKLLPRELNYTTTEKECLSINWAINKFKYFLH